MSALSPPKGASKSSSKKNGKTPAKRRTRSTGVAAKLTGRFQAQANRQKQMTDLAVFGGEVGGSAFLASAAAGYFGDAIKLGDKVDARLIAGGGALAFGAWKPNKPNFHAVNTGLGILTSWLAEQGFDMGVENKEAMDEKGAEPEEPAETVEADGIVLGNVDEAGAFLGIGKQTEKQLARKLARLRKQAVARGSDWKDVRTAAKLTSEKKGWEWGGPEPTAAAPGRRQPRVYFRGATEALPEYIPEDYVVRQPRFRPERRVVRRPRRFRLWQGRYGR